MSEPFYCSTCGRRFHNTAWHAEQCDGRPQADPGPCDGRATSPERRCKLPYGHVGPHEWRRGL